MPTRENDTIVSDLAAIWYHLPHSTIGANEAKYTGLGGALPNIDSDCRGELRAADDYWVAREDRDLWIFLEIPTLRDEALQVVLDDFIDGKLATVQDVLRYIEPFEELPHEPLEPLMLDAEGQEIDPAEPDEEDGARTGTIHSTARAYRQWRAPAGPVLASPARPARPARAEPARPGHR